MKSFAIVSLLLLLTPLRALENDESEDLDVVRVMRCCRSGQDLEPRSLRCVPSSTPFKPLIYSPDDGVYLESVPTWWRVRQDARPRCEPRTRQLRYLQYSKSNPYFVFDSGLVVTELGAGVELRPHEYCLGSNALLACTPVGTDSSEGRPRLRKCCGENAAYDK